jgi:hypothetical protein
VKGYYFPLGGAGSEIACIPIDVTSVVRPDITTILTGLQNLKFKKQFKKLPCKFLEGICNVAKSQLNFPQFLLEVLNILPVTSS